jgi:hypothetical protein
MKTRILAAQRDERLSRNVLTRLPDARYRALRCLIVMHRLWPILGVALSVLATFGVRAAGVIGMLRFVTKCYGFRK